MNFHQGDTRVIYSIEFSKDGKYLAVNIFVFDGLLKMYANRFDLISSISNWIFLGYLDNKCRIWKFDPTKNILSVTSARVKIYVLLKIYSYVIKIKLWIFF